MFIHAIHFVKLDLLAPNVKVSLMLAGDNVKIPHSIFCDLVLSTNMQT
jgi:hypothetical protein